jgi:hypothetical protein
MPLSQQAFSFFAGIVQGFEIVIGRDAVFVV